MGDRSIPSFGRGVPPPSPDGVAPERSGPAPVAPENSVVAGAGAARRGFLARLGLPAREGPASSRTDMAAPSPQPVSGSGTLGPAVGPDRMRLMPSGGLPDIDAIANAIRRRLPLLDAEDARRYERMLTTILQTCDAGKHPLLLKELASSVVAAARRKRVLSQRSSAWAVFTRTSVALRFEDSVAALSKRREAELLDLGGQLLALPAPFAESYQSVLREILAEPDLQTREALLAQLRRQVAAHLRQR